LSFSSRYSACGISFEKVDTSMQTALLCLALTRIQAQVMYTSMAAHKQMIRHRYGATHPVAVATSFTTPLQLLLLMRFLSGPFPVKQLISAESRETNKQYMFLKITQMSL
jgi:hypothetical protein